MALRKIHSVKAGPAAVDPTNPQSWNRYAYVNNSPLRYTDPLGLFLHDCAWDGTCMAASFGQGGGPGCGGGAGGIFVDGLPQTVSTGLGGNGMVQCPNNVCNGFTKSGQYFQFFAGAGGVSGYLRFGDIVQGINEANGTFYSNAQYQAYLAQTYPDNIAGQLNRLLSNLIMLFGSKASADPNNPNVVGGHANFELTCSDMTLCGPGRYDNGIHIEYNSSGNLVVHDDTVSPWRGAFSFSALFTANFWEHGFVDYLGGQLCNCVFPQ